MKILGIDIGSVAISIVQINENKEIIKSSYIFHEGKITERLAEELKTYDLSDIYAIAATNSVPKILKQGKRYDNIVSFITAAQYHFPQIGSLLIVGGERFGLALFDQHGNYKGFKTNTSCAAGTGSFLDQQARRLRFENIQEFASTALNNKGDFPKIASRCAVFAKTDLIHAQQEGYTREEIADGLSYGLAKNIVDTLFSAADYHLPIIFVGGLALNQAVVKHIKNLLSTEEVFTHPQANIFGAFGAALNALDELPVNATPLEIKSIEDIIIFEKPKKTYYYPPLELKLSDYPDFSSKEKYKFQSKVHPNTTPVETDIYEELRSGHEYDVYMGIDIGSTSTKATIVQADKTVLIGLYTRTSGQPVIAVQTIFETLKDIEQRKNISFNFLGVGTTGSGRKFIGKIIKADVILDEITAHARAAYELDPEVDTIIEIGGQDSKFTTLRNGMVTLSIMNNVCAAGTGSFIEEQAQKLGVPLSEYADRAMQARAPIANDRCTVFMERDINQYLNKGYTVEEVLAAVLHSIRENYLSKVAVESLIGKKIFFQGATAKNKALVAAFEQKLQRPIMVSKFCHLTGALGVALTAIDKGIKQTSFRGLDIYNKDIPVRTEICNLCPNFCKLKVAEIDGEVEAYGFLCGRDYNVNKFVNYNKSGFDLIKEYRKNFLRFRPQNEKKATITIGLPAGLYMYEDLPKWRKFFDLLGYRTITSEKVHDVIKRGKHIAAAEFCAPMAAMHAHVKEVADKSDYVFLPIYLEERQKNKNIRRAYCYYTQFLPAVIKSNKEFENVRLISPLLYTRQSGAFSIYNLYKALHKAGLDLSPVDVVRAYEEAVKYHDSLKENWKKTFNRYNKDDGKIKVMFLGRPYTTLSPAMNANIPDIFAKNGIKTFFMDMIDVSDEEVENIQFLLNTIKWKYAARIIAVAEKVARMDGVYPVYITSYKCSPDSFTLEYFKSLMEAHKKPYLILQLDEHDSSVGYETRIEAAINAFSNHYKLSHEQKTQQKQEVNICHTDAYIKDAKKLKGKTLLLPSWDNYVTPLLKSALDSFGVNTVILYDTPENIVKSTTLNSNQCIPISIIVQNALDTVIKQKLDPKNTVVWLVESSLACNFSMYPFFLKKIFVDKKHLYPDLDKIQVYLGDLSFFDFSFMTSVKAYLSYMFGGYIKKIGTRIRPYEVNKGETDFVIKQSIEKLANALKSDNLGEIEGTLRQVIDEFKQIPVNPEPRPKVAIFGDLYVRDNDVLNQDLIHYIEQNGGEVITTPYNEYLKLITTPYMQRRFKEGFVLDAATIRLIKSIIPVVDKKFYPYFQEILNEPMPDFETDLEQIFEEFNISTMQFGESFDNILKIIYLTKEYRNQISFFVQLNPAYCAAAIITQAMAHKIEKVTGIPVVTIEYDGTNEFKNEAILPYLKFAKEKLKLEKTIQ